jgi:hypothetical protein
MSKFTIALARPFLPPETRLRLRLRHQRLDAEAGKRAGWRLRIPEVTVTLVKAVDSSGPGRGMRLVPTLSGNVGYQARWCRLGAMEWDHRRVTIIGDLGRGVWAPDAGGLRPGFDPVEVRQAGRRPTGTGECLDRLAAIATVGLAGHVLQRIVFLDGEARELGWIPAPYFAEADVIRFAQAAGIPYRGYAFTFAGFSSTRVSPPELCEALFTRSARRMKLISDELDAGDDWFSDPSRPVTYRRPSASG